MKSLKLFFTGFACMCLLVQTTLADFKLDPLKLKRLSDVMTVDLMEEQFKMIFTTEEDHRLISYEAVKARKLTEKWLWRLEPQGDSVAFRVNGKVQAYFKFEEGSNTTTYVNGTKIQYKKGMSFQNFLSQVEKATKDKSAKNFDSLFFNEAEAVFWLFPFVVGGALGLWWGARQCRASTPAQNEPPAGEENLPTPVEVSEITSCPTGTCGRTQPRPARTCRVNTRRYTRVSPFTSQQMRESATNFCEYQRNANRNGNTRRGCFTDVNACTAWKTRRPDHAFNHNLSEDRARAICSSIYNEIVECSGQRTPEQPYTPPADNDPYNPGVHSTK